MIKKCDQGLISSIKYPDFIDGRSFIREMDLVKNELYGNILNALHRFLGLAELTETEKKLWLIAITTRKHGLIYFMNQKEAHAHLYFASQYRHELEKIAHILEQRQERTRDIINYAFHKFVKNPSSNRTVEIRDNELISHNGIHSICARRVAIKKNGAFDREPELFSYDKDASSKQYYFENDNEGCYDGHDVAHYIVALLGDYDFLDSNTSGSADSLPKDLIRLFTAPSHPFNSFVIFSHLLRPAFDRYFTKGKEENAVAKMAFFLKNYLLGKSYLFDPKNNRNVRPVKPIDVVQLAASVQAAIGEVPVSFAERIVFTRGANSQRSEDMVLDTLDRSNVFERVYKIASGQVSFFQDRVIIRQKAQIAAYLLVANTLLENSQMPEEIELLEEIIYRIKNCFGAKISGENLYHKLNKSSLLHKYGYSY